MCFLLIFSSSAGPGSQTEANRLLTVDIHSPADVCAAQSVGDLAGDRLEEERVVHDGFVEVTGGFLYNLAFFCPPVEENRALSWCCFVSLAMSTCSCHSVGGSTARAPLISGDLGTTSTGFGEDPSERCVRVPLQKPFQKKPKFYYPVSLGMHLILKDCEGPQ